MSPPKSEEGRDARLRSAVWAKGAQKGLGPAMRPMAGDMIRKMVSMRARWARMTGWYEPGAEAARSDYSEYDRGGRSTFIRDNCLVVFWAAKTPVFET